MPLLLVRNDITQMQVDAIVNPTNPRMKPGGGVDAAIHQAAGPELKAACKIMRPLKVGHAVVTEGYHLPCKYVIHTVGPRWYNGQRKEEAILRQCYRESLQLAQRYDVQSIAFPLIAAGTRGFPRELVMPIAIEEIRSFLESWDMTVFLVVYDSKSYALSRKHFPEVQAFIDEAYVESHPVMKNRRFIVEDCSSIDFGAPMPSAPISAPIKSSHRKSAPQPRQANPALEATLDLSDLIANLDESFSQMVLRKIDEKGMTDAQCYKKANLDRKLFSKIRNPGYKPSKPTALALAVALELSLSETKDLLMKAGFALSRSSVFDVIIEYCISNRIYDIMKINEILFSFDQSLLGNI